jgi:hypothetical protein
MKTSDGGWRLKYVLAFAFFWQVPLLFVVNLRRWRGRKRGWAVGRGEELITQVEGIGEATILVFELVNSNCHAQPWPTPVQIF